VTAYFASTVEISTGIHISLCFSFSKPIRDCQNMSGNVPVSEVIESLQAQVEELKVIASGKY
jgi:hypothetical protein